MRAIGEFGRIITVGEAGGIITGFREARGETVGGVTGGTIGAKEGLLIKQEGGEIIRDEK